MSNEWQPATVIGVPAGNQETYTFMTADQAGFGAGGDVAKRIKEDWDFQMNEIVDITLTDGREKQVKAARRPLHNSGARPGQVASAA